MNNQIQLKELFEDLREQIIFQEPRKYIYMQVITLWKELWYLGMNQKAYLAVVQTIFLI